MKYKIKNLLYQPLRVVITNRELIVRSRSKKGEIIVDNLTPQLKSMNSKGFIKVSIVTEKKIEAAKKAKANKGKRKAKIVETIGDSSLFAEGSAETKVEIQPIVVGDTV